MDSVNAQRQYSVIVQIPTIMAGFAARPRSRWTKADQREYIELVETDRGRLLDDLKRAQKELQDRKKRDRSPRRLSASMSHDQLSVTCSAMHQVQLWERDAMLGERDARIRELQAVIDKQKEDIASLRRGDGPIGEVMLHNFPAASEASKARILATTTPVNQTLRNIQLLQRNLGDALVWGSIGWWDVDLAHAAVTALAPPRPGF